MSGSIPTSGAHAKLNQPSSILSLNTDGGDSIGGNSVSLSNNDCVRWCMNVVLQSFVGEPWAVALRPVNGEDHEITHARSSDIACRNCLEEEKGACRCVKINSSHTSTGDELLGGKMMGTSPTQTDLMDPMGKGGSIISAHSKGNLDDSGERMSSHKSSINSANNSISTFSSSVSCTPPLNPSSPLPHQLKRSVGGTPPTHSSTNSSSHNMQQTTTKLKPKRSNIGIELVQVDYFTNPVDLGDEGSPQWPPVEYSSEEAKDLAQCVKEINEPSVSYHRDELVLRFSNVEFAPLTSPNGEHAPDGEGALGKQSGELLAAEAAGDGQTQYRLLQSLEPMLTSTLEPAVSAVIDHCVNAMVLVYGATQEMKQLGLIGTPEECGLLPQGIRMLTERYAERKEMQATEMGVGSSFHRRSAVISDRLTHETDETSSNGSGSSPPRFVFPKIGDTTHRFARAVASFIAFDASNVVDLLDLANKNVELALQLAPQPIPSPFDETDDEKSKVGGPTSATPTTDAFVCYAASMPAETTNDALGALDVGLENLARALEVGLLQSESGSSLLFSLTTYTDNCHCATFHVLCLAEDPAAQTWLASTVLARSQAIPIGEEQSWASIQNTPMPPALHHNAAKLLVPLLCFGNMFASVLICAYNSAIALGRLNRDLNFALTGYRMRTMPKVTSVASRKGSRQLPPDWEELFTADGRPYYVEKSTQRSTWQDPRFVCAKDNNGTELGLQSLVALSPEERRRQSRIYPSQDDKDFMTAQLYPATNTLDLQMLERQRFLSENQSEFGIVVLDATSHHRLLLNSSHERFQKDYENFTRNFSHDAVPQCGGLEPHTTPSKASELTTSSFPLQSSDINACHLAERVELPDHSDAFLNGNLVQKPELTETLPDSSYLARHLETTNQVNSMVSNLVDSDIRTDALPIPPSDCDSTEGAFSATEKHILMSEHIKSSMDLQANQMRTEKSEFNNLPHENIPFKDELTLEPIEASAAEKPTVLIPQDHNQSNHTKTKQQQKEEEESILETIRTSQFYHNALNEKIPPRLNLHIQHTSSNHEFTSTTETTSASSVYQKYHSPSSESQELDVLVDHFARFFRDSYESKKRVIALEQQMAKANEKMQLKEEKHAKEVSALRRELEDAKMQIAQLTQALGSAKNIPSRCNINAT